MGNYITPVDFVPSGSRLRFMRQSEWAIGNYLRIQRGEPQVRAKAIYRCQCGNIVELVIDKVKSGHAASCGCLSKDFPHNYKHGLHDHPLYVVWVNMRNRCYKRTDRAYRWYGARGVEICDEWLSDFKNFYEWAIANGWEKGLEVDKDIKGSGLLYSPESCTLVTSKINANNTRNNRFIEYNGERKTLAQWSDKLAVPRTLIPRRLKAGWSIERAITTPKGKNRRNYLTPAIAKKIRLLRAQGNSKKKISKLMGIGYVLLSRVLDDKNI